MWLGSKADILTFGDLELIQFHKCWIFSFSVKVIFLTIPTSVHPLVQSFF
jgi:hypothetical protein